MAIVFSQLVFAQTLIDTSIYYTSQELNRLLGTAEKFCIQYKTTNVSGTSPRLDVTVEQADFVAGDNWAFRGKIINSAALSNGATGVGYDLGTAVGGGFIRLNVQLSGTTPKAYVELWLTGRDAY